MTIDRTPSRDIFSATTAPITTTRSAQISVLLRIAYHLVYQYTCGGITKSAENARRLSTFTLESPRSPMRVSAAGKGNTGHELASR